MTTPPDKVPARARSRAARGSVHEAIGKLIGDDAARDHGTAEKQAGTQRRGAPPGDDQPE
jgi:uncharacterized protein YjbJ (UPF0337 family)